MYVYLKKISTRSNQFAPRSQCSKPEKDVAVRYVENPLKKRNPRKKKNETLKMSLISIAISPNSNSLVLATTSVASVTAHEIQPDQP